MNLDVEYILIDKKDNVIISTLQDSSKDIIQYVNNHNELIFINEIKYRVGKIENEKGSLILITKDKSFIKSSTKFRTKAKLLLEFLSEMEDYRNDVMDYTLKELSILTHNLITINAHSIQDMFDFISQDDLKDSDVKGLRKIIKNSIKNDLDKATTLFFRILKNNIETKTEFSVYGKLYSTEPVLNYKNYNVYNVLSTILYNFFPDFIDKKIELNVEKASYIASFDYESIQVALYHMIDNITKYILKGTTLVITFVNLLDEVVMQFSMISLKIEENEKEKIFMHGFSGVNALKNEKSGKGIGMSRVKQILELNNSSITLNIGEVIVKESDYCNNIFSIHLKKENYHN